MKKALIYTATLVLTLGIPLVLGVALSLSIPPPSEEQTFRTVTVKPGLSFAEVTRLLQEQGVVCRRTLFSLLVRAQHLDTQIKCGEYQFSTRMLPGEVLGKLVRGEQINCSITIPEGLTIAQIASAYESAGLADARKFRRLASDPTFIASLGMAGPTLEGYLFPDTYRFFRTIGEEHIIRCMVQRFQEVYAKELQAREQELNLSRKEVITLASLIEKEARYGEERPLVSAVFHNRLRLGMRLQCDPTVIYGINDFNGDLTGKDLATPGPYNTYLCAGLPPTPIANPGLASIRAALFPEQVGYLYFVSMNNGRHQFSVSLAEHSRAVRFYQKSLRKDKAASEAEAASSLD